MKTAGNTTKIHIHTSTKKIKLRMTQNRGDYLSTFMYDI